MIRDWIMEWKIIDEIPFKENRSRQQWNRRMKSQIIKHGLRPIRAKYDKAGNCQICGEAGECPGWHIAC